mmetsp:Transcript_22613/g.65767  ORF Transcript_22613/g.65767 Transcript_22613/m.65767 type:complete len:253 (+) Transcript_22613:1022-1780(+)
MAVRLWRCTCPQTGGSSPPARLGAGSRSGTWGSTAPLLLTRAVMRLATPKWPWSRSRRTATGVRDWLPRRPQRPGRPPEPLPAVVLVRWGRAPLERRKTWLRKRGSLHHASPCPTPGGLLNPPRLQRGVRRRTFRGSTLRRCALSQPRATACRTSRVATQLRRQFWSGGGPRTPSPSTVCPAAKPSPCWRPFLVPGQARPSRARRRARKVAKAKAAREQTRGAAAALTKRSIKPNVWRRSRSGSCLRESGAS